MKYGRDINRKLRKRKNMDNHIKFLYNRISAGKMTFDFEKIKYKKKISKLTGKEELSLRTEKEIKYIIDRLVSLQELNKNKK
jgi:hypothetical protein